MPLHYKLQNGGHMWVYVVYVPTYADFRGFMWFMHSKTKNYVVQWIVYVVYVRFMCPRMQIFVVSCGLCTPKLKIMLCIGLSKQLLIILCLDDNLCSMDNSIMEPNCVQDMYNTRVKHTCHVYF